MTSSIEQTLDALKAEYVASYRRLHNDLQTLRAYRQEAATVERRQRAEAAIAAKRAELLALRKEAMEQAGVEL